MLAEAKVVVHAQRLRSGNTASARGVKAFLAETLARHAAGGFSALRVARRLGLLCHRISRRARTPRVALCDRGADESLTCAAQWLGSKQWTPLLAVLEAAETNYQAYGWQAPRRLVVVARKPSANGPRRAGRKLLEVLGYTFHVLVTTLRGMTRYKPGASTTAAPNAKTASRNSRKILVQAAFACTPSMVPKPPFG